MFFKVNIFYLVLFVFFEEIVNNFFNFSNLFLFMGMFFRFLFFGMLFRGFFMMFYGMVRGFFFLG